MNIEIIGNKNYKAFPGHLLYIQGMLFYTIMKYLLILPGFKSW